MSWRETLAQVATALNEAGITYAVGGSVLLLQHGLVEQVNDIDLVVAIEDVNASHEVLQALGAGSPGASESPFYTIHFYEYEIGGTSVDVMGRLRIGHGNGVYELAFDQKSIASQIRIGDAQVPLMSLEQWYVLYQLMPGKEHKVALIEDSFRREGRLNREFTQKALNAVLPVDVRERVYQLLAQLPEKPRKTAEGD